MERGKILETWFVRGLFWCLVESRGQAQQQARVGWLLQVNGTHHTGTFVAVFWGL